MIRSARQGTPARMACPREEIRCSDFITGSAFLSMKKGRSAALAMEEKGLAPGAFGRRGAKPAAVGKLSFFQWQ